MIDMGRASRDNDQGLCIVLHYAISRQPAGAAAATTIKESSRFSPVLFQPIAFETLASAADFFFNRLVVVFVFHLMTREELFFFCQSLSVCVQCVNSLILQNIFIADSCGITHKIIQKRIASSKNLFKIIIFSISKELISSLTYSVMKPELRLDS